MTARRTLEVTMAECPLHMFVRCLGCVSPQGSVTTNHKSILCLSHVLYTHILNRTHVRTKSVILRKILHIWLSLGLAGKSPGPQPCHNPSAGPRQYRHSPQHAEPSGFLGVKPTHGPQLDYKALIFTWKTQKPSYRQFFLLHHRVIKI